MKQERELTTLRGCCTLVQRVEWVFQCRPLMERQEGAGEGSET